MIKEIEMEVNEFKRICIGTKKVIGYLTSDGQEFREEFMAKEHERIYEFDRRKAIEEGIKKHCVEVDFAMLDGDYGTWYYLTTLEEAKMKVADYKKLELPAWYLIYYTPDLHDDYTAHAMSKAEYQEGIAKMLASMPID